MIYKRAVDLTGNQNDAPDKATRLILLTDRIATEPPKNADKTFYPRFLLLCTFPHSNPGNDVARWKRQNGPSTLLIQPGWDIESDSSLGIPYGSIPRLLMAWIVTEATRKQSRRLELGHSLSEFMREVGLDPRGGGKRSDYARMKRAMRNLFGARITFHTQLSNPKGVGEHISEMSIAPERQLWWSPQDPNQSVLWGSWIELSERFYHAIMSSVVPCDLRALKALKQSPLALDLYMLFNYHGATKPKPHPITWKMFQEQLGVDYADTDNLKKKIKAATRKVLLAHRGLKVSYPKKGGGIIIHPSKPAIPRKEPKTIDG